VKVLKEAKIIGKKVTSTDADLAFTAVKDKSLKKINFAQFVDAVDYLCGKSGNTPTALHQQIIKN